ncbi:MAG TPA: ATP-dependent zinc metalloprotease FtsH, partial [Acidimicrobiales bacterium]|nr:ATP-dependent zinc metalloprotease FtsH [Acidimicrobiales bacterium]
TRITPTVTLTYSQFLSDVSSKHIKTVTIGSNGNVSGSLSNGEQFTGVVPVSPADPDLYPTLRQNGVQIDVSAPGTSLGTEILDWALLLAPFVLVFYLWRRLSRGAAGPMQGVLGVGRSKAKVFDADSPKTTFADVAGYEGAKREIAEVVEFLRSPDKYRRAGAVAPRGVLMVGPPGTGKTLLARAVAGEASVPFFSVTGSSFVEMFVGVGAARVRDLFAEARKRAPGIIFVDEIDAIGQRRGGAGALVANDEREQTLNQLLAEMDGFDMSMGIVVLAATNRPEVLDPALLRPGRFDRQVTIPLPTLAERVAVLAVHCRDKRLGPDVDLQVVARGTPGFSGADLANLANEAAIVAVRANREVLAASDFDQARDRIILGRREGSNVLLPEEKHAVAVHEAGHALVAALSPKAEPVAKVTILPAGQALGVTEQLPLVERHLYGEDYLKASLAVRLGGRAAELVELGQGSTGAANDLAGATELAVKMVREFGLSSTLGPIGYPEGGSVFLGGGGPGLSSRPFAEGTQAKIDSEVSALLSQAEKQAVELLTANRDRLRRLVDLLLQEETVDGSQVYAIAGVPEPDRPEVGPMLEPSRAAASAKAKQEA